MKTTPCRSCGKPVLFAADPAGKTIPLDPRPPCYVWSEFDGQVKCKRIHQAAVSHFATCPGANQFSGSKRQGVD